MPGFLGFCWRALQSNPAAAIGGSAMTIAGISYQDWLKSVAQNPPPILTNHFFQLIVIAIGVLLLAYVFYSEAERERAPKPRPNMDMAKAIEYLRIRSRWAVGRLYYDKNREQTDLTGLLEEEIQTLIRDAATQGRVTIWGRPTDTKHMFELPIEIEIDASEWTEYPFDLTTMDGDTPHGVTARDRRVGEDRYRYLRVDSREIFREWPAASYYRLLFDKTWKSRKERDCG